MITLHISDEHLELARLKWKKLTDDKFPLTSSGMTEDESLVVHRWDNGPYHLELEINSDGEEWFWMDRIENTWGE